MLLDIHQFVLSERPLCGCLVATVLFLLHEALSPLSLYVQCRVSPQPLVSCFGSGGAVEGVKKACSTPCGSKVLTVAGERCVKNPDAISGKGVRVKCVLMVLAAMPWATGQGG